MTNPIGDFEGLKARLKSTWMAGDFGEIAKSVESHAEEFIGRRSIKQECGYSMSHAVPAISPFPLPKLALA